ncbi:MAG: hypothetical protein OXG84_00605 [Chloroflexi bacterium]|nr:hypothetical protein [Chloroflexota bacterium]
MSRSPGTCNLEFLRKLIQHNCWEDGRVWQLAIAPLSDAQFVQAVPFGAGSIQRECWQIIETERKCLRSVRGDAQNSAREIPDAPDRALMRGQWRALHGEWRQFAKELDADLLVSACRFPAEGGEAELLAWQLIINVIYQGSTHRSNIMRMVAAVHEPAQFDLSLMQYLTGVFR